MGRIERAYDWKENRIARSVEIPVALSLYFPKAPFSEKGCEVFVALSLQHKRTYVHVTQYCILSAATATSSSFSWSPCSFTPKNGNSNNNGSSSSNNNSDYATAPRNPPFENSCMGKKGLDRRAQPDLFFALLVTCQKRPSLRSSEKTGKKGGGGGGERVF